MNEMQNQLQQKDIDYLTKEVAEIKKTVNEGFAAIQAELRIMSDSYVKREELDRELKVRDQAIKNTEDNIRWVVRSIIGIVIAAVVGFVITHK